MEKFQHSSAPLRQVVGIQFGIMDPDFLVRRHPPQREHEALWIFHTTAPRFLGDLALRSFCKDTLTVQRSQDWLATYITVP